MSANWNDFNVKEPCIIKHFHTHVLFLTHTNIYPDIPHLRCSVLHAKWLPILKYPFITFAASTKTIKQKKLAYSRSLCPGKNVTVASLSSTPTQQDL